MALISWVPFFVAGLHMGYVIALVIILSRILMNSSLMLHVLKSMRTMQLRVKTRGLPMLLVTRLLVLVMQLLLLLLLLLMLQLQLLLLLHLQLILLMLKLLKLLKLLVLLVLLMLPPNLFLVPRIFPFISSGGRSDETPFLIFPKLWITNKSKPLATGFSSISGGAFLDIDRTIDGRKAHRDAIEPVIERANK